MASQEPVPIATSTMTIGIIGRLELFVVGAGEVLVGDGVGVGDALLLGEGELDSPVAPGLKVAVVTGSGRRLVSISSIEDAEVSPAAEVAMT